ncbi:hypothetical protein N752_29355 [Desulforamulus aquiferis]|nr:MFS transporter [Desulforamulus aquiferis]RYD01685.1 hypothetical protein N752_29355 [Desulforamulus aquiferis]
MGTFLQGLTGSIVNVAIPKLMAVFGTNANDIQWVLTAYMLTQGIIIALAGYLGDKYGYKKTFVVALILFTLGSFLCGAAVNLNMMIISRVIQGIGAGIIILWVWQCVQDQSHIQNWHGAWRLGYCRNGNYGYRTIPGWISN